ncbi:MAG: hypothetical protein Kow0092_25950 [Deferrisomatales bacterium]
MSREGRSNLKEEKARATRKKIIEAATHLFARQGFHKTTMWDVASSIKMTPGAIFHHYATKEALLNAVVDELDKEMDPYVAYLDEHPQLSSRDLSELARMMVRRFHTQPDAIICLASLATEFGGTEDPIVPKVRKAYNRFVEAFTRSIEGHSKVRNPRATAISFIAAVQGMGVQALLREGQESLDELVDGFLNILAEW